MHCKVNYSCQRSVSNTGLIWSVRLLGLPLNFLTCVEAASQLWPTICKTSLLESQMVMLKVFRRIFSSSRSTTWCYVSGVFIWNLLKLANNIYGSLRYYERNGAAHIKKIFSSLPNQGKQEAIRSLYFGRICGSEGTNWRPCSFLRNRCWVLFIAYWTWRVLEIKTLEQGDTAYCYLRNEINIYSLRNGNMLLIS